MLLCAVVRVQCGYPATRADGAGGAVQKLLGHRQDLPQGKIAAAHKTTHISRACSELTLKLRLPLVQDLGKSLVPDPTLTYEIKKYSRNFD
jgi:hypothetical protein